MAGASLRNVIMALIVLLLPAAARVVRAQALMVKEMDYVLAARAIGASAWRIIFRRGGMLSITGQKYVEVSPWLVFFPSIAVSVAVFSFNLLGDALRDALDPRLKGLQS
jgi:peptide/nickel transport system permease protein